MNGVNWSRLVSIAIITSLLSCFLLAPFWAIALLIVKIFEPNATVITRQSNPVTIPPSNEFADDWEFKFYEIESN